MLITMKRAKAFKQLSPLAHCHGFSLVEVLVALTIFSFAVLGLAIGTVSIAQTNNTSNLNAGAINMAQAKIEELRAMSSTAFAALSCSAYTSTGCYDTVTASGKSFARAWRISTTSSYKTIEVKVDWTDYTVHSLTFVASMPL